jgi:hypothetical protein
MKQMLALANILCFLSLAFDTYSKNPTTQHDSFGIDSVFTKGGNCSFGKSLHVPQIQFCEM